MPPERASARRSSAPAQSRPACPRCGYDLTGDVAAWKDACPLKSVCSECGHRLVWADIFDRSRNDVAWLVEHARSPRDWAGRAVKTVARASCPPAYWRRVSLDARVRILPLVFFVGALFTVPYLVSAAVWFQRRLSFLYARTSGYTDLEMAHRSIVGAICHPVGRVWDVGAVWATSIDWTRHWQMLAFLMIAHTAWPVLMLALPVTRARAKVRRAHVMRAWLTGFVAVLPGWVICLVLTHRYTWSFGPRVWSWILTPGVMVWIAVPFVSWWWWSTVTTGWRVEQPRAVYWSLLACSILLATVVSLGIDIDMFATVWWLLR